MFEGLDDRRHGIEAHDGGQIKTHHLLSRYLTQRIDDRRGVHPQRHKEGEQDLKVTILSRHRGDNNAEAQGQTSHHHDKQRKQQQIPVGTRCLPNDGIIEIHHHKQPQLYAEPHQIADRIRERHNETWEIHLAENARIGDESVRSPPQTIRKILPHGNAAQVEQRLWNAVCGDARDAAKHDHVHDNR